MVENELGSAFGPDEVLLCQGDSSSATGWLAKSSFGDECPLHLRISRLMARYLNDHKISHYSQWFPGKYNSVADSLSRDFHLSDADLISQLHLNFPNQLPQSFRIVHLTATMTSSVGELLQSLPKTQQLPREPAPSATATGHATRGSWRRSVTSEIRSSGGSENASESKCWPATPPPCEKGGPIKLEELRNLALDDRRAQFVPPSTAWLRPLGLTNLAAPSTTIEDDSDPFWPRS